MIAMIKNIFPRAMHKGLIYIMLSVANWWRNKKKKKKKLNSRYIVDCRETAAMPAMTSDEGLGYTLYDEVCTSLHNNVNRYR